MLRPERRRELVALATRIGLRDFDANLVIAIVQDGARTGRAGLDGEVADRLEMVRPARGARADGLWIVVRVLFAAGAALAAVVALVRWLVGGR